MLGHKLRRNVAGGGTIVKSLTYLNFSSVDIIAATTPTTFSAIDLGAPDTNRVIVVTGHLFSNVSGSDITSITIGGQAMTNLVKAIYVATGTNNTTVAGVWMLAVPSGTSADIVFSVNNAVPTRGIGIYRFITDVGSVGNVASSATVTSNKTLPLVTSGGSFVIAASQIFNGSNPTWSANVTKNYGVDIRSSEFASGASGYFAAAGTQSIVNSSNYSLCAAELF